jgi:hypothetical protein
MPGTFLNKVMYLFDVCSVIVSMPFIGALYVLGLVDDGRKTV